jgi:2,4'-dihydroxyacetophenone dioxygenase
MAEAQNLSEPAAYSGLAADRARAGDATGPSGEALWRFREVVLRTGELDWVEKTLAGLSHKLLWRDDATGASIALVRFERGSGIPSPHAHASNQFMFCLTGRYTYTATGITLTPGCFYWNPKGAVHGPTRAEETSVLLELYDGPHYPTQPDWYADPEDAR